MKPLAEKPTPGNILPTKDEFIIWCQSPVTQFVARAYETAAVLQKEDWLQKSWEGGQSDPLSLAICKTREDAYLAFLQTGFEDYEEIIIKGYK